MNNFFKNDIVKSKLGKKLIVYFLLAGILPLIFFAFFIFLNTRKSLVYNSEKEFVKYSRMAGQEIFRNLSQSANNLETISQISCVSENLKNPLEFKKCLEDSLEKFTDFKALTFLDFNGNKLVESLKDNDTTFSIDVDKEKVKQIFKYKKTIVTEPYKVRDANFTTVNLYSPVYKNKHLIGILAGRMNREVLWEVTKGLYYLEDAVIYILNKNGQVLVSSENIKPFAYIFPKNYINLIAKETSGTKTIKDKRQIKIVCGHFQVFLKGAFLVDNWHVIIVKSLDSLLSPLNVLMQSFFIFFVLSFSLVILISFHSIRSILEPINNLTAGIKKLSSGKIGSQVEVQTVDEIGELTFAFNKMSLDLKTANDKLTNYNIELEKIVQEKTKELSSALEKLKSMQNQIIISEKLAAIGKLSAGIAHEINTPLTSIAGYAQAILRRIESMTINDKKFYENILEYLEIIYSQAFQCKKIIQDLLDFSRQKIPNFETCELKQIIKNSLASLEEKISLKKADIVFENNNKFTINADSEQLQQVFVNILSNGLDAINERGAIEIEIKEITDKVFVIFKDNGKGISPDIMDKIFDPFFTTKNLGEGTGLGLAISQDIINNHNGEILLESTLNKGSYFKIVLPK